VINLEYNQHIRWEERVTRNPNAVPEAPEERNEKELAALGYLWVFGLIILVTKRANPFIQHHARRGTVLFVLSLFAMAHRLASIW